MVDLNFTANPVPGAILTGGFKETGPVYPAGGHKGVDWGGVADGVAVYSFATTPTKVFAIHEVDGHNNPLDGWGNGSLGNCVVVDHIGTPWYGYYCHLQNIGPIAVGVDLFPGSIVGYVGRTGQVTGTHLHHALCKNTGHVGDVNTEFADPRLFVTAAPTAPPPLSLEARLARLERIVAAYGVKKFTSPDVYTTISGEEALAYCDLKQYSAMLSAQNSNIAIGELAEQIAILMDEGMDDSRLRDDLITAVIDLAEDLRTKR